MLTEAAILSLVVNPSCGAVKMPDQSDLARHLVATALQESGGDPYIIGINADSSRHLPAGKVHSFTAAEAAAKAWALLAQGRRIDLGLFQISNAQLDSHHLTVDTAFDPCRNTGAGADHLAGDYAWVIAHRLYNCGHVDCGEAYAEAVVARVDATEIPEPRSAPRVLDPDDPAPPSWDMEATAGWRRRHNPTPEDAVTMRPETLSTATEQPK